MQQHILITGASGAIGGALAEAYAAPGVSLCLLGQKITQLESVARRCRALGASVTVKPINLLDVDGLRLWLHDYCQTTPPDLVIANAGMNINVSNQLEGELWTEMDALLNLNVRSTFALVNAVLPSMRQRKSGQIALVSSLAAYYGLPMTPSYCASKAAIKAYGEGLRALLSGEGIRVNVIMPGYVSSPMCDAMHGPKPFVWSPQRAAKYIKRKLARDCARISFPFPLNYGSWWLAVLPSAVSQWMLRLTGYRV
ncbi:SDR family NAD(P)-dependent oxidoreductase [Chitinibacter sp. SCUT-21]|uniref:SDR family NAD(P)-dependent oxidoreductase n=1 Tax=Chitinibacter sp. SCUT-21 TaxID=2970891 RepID=UPI0035A651B3